MLTTPHSLTGAVIAVLIPHPLLSVPLAIGSHFILDSIPHWQETLYPYNPSIATWIRIPIDIALSIALIFWITQTHPIISSTIWLTALASNLPDLDSVCVLSPQLPKIKWLKKYWDWHCKIQRETSSLFGLIPQVLLSGVCLFISRLVY